MKAIVTGAAGFVGFHVAKRLASEGFDIVAIDNLNEYYPVALKETRLSALDGKSNIRFVRANIANPNELAAAIAGDVGADIIVHLAAQAGVRYSVENPAAYVDANVHGQVTDIRAGPKNAKEAACRLCQFIIRLWREYKVPFSESDPSIVLFLFMLRPSARLNSWHTLIGTFTRLRRLASGFSRSMALTAVLTWLPGCLPMRY